MSDRKSETLDVLDPPAWGDVPPDATGLVRTCHALRHKPLADFDAEDLRVMILQQLSLRFLVPRAIAILESNHLVEALAYPGDLLNAVLRVERSYWLEHVDQWGDVNLIADEVMDAVKYMSEPLKAFKFDTFK